MKKYFIYTLGCQMNKADSEKLAAYLEDQGYQPTNTDKDADLVAILACSVRQSAVDRIYGMFKKWNKRPELKKILAGCVLPKDRKKLENKFDLILDTKKLDILTKKFTPLRRFYPVAYVPIMTGCNNFCTYCAVPYTRGRERSFPKEKIITESKKLVKEGFKDIVLFGQNVNSYQYGFAGLLEEVAQIPGDFWIHFASPHPKDFNDKIIDVIARYPKIAKQINLPLQSGSDKILKKMNRPYTIKQYLDLVRKIRKKIPDVAFSTDLIVGFPGETEKDFKDTARVFNRLEFDMAYIAQYSPRPGTAAALLKDNLSKSEKRRREKELTKILAKTALAKNKKLINQTLQVLVEKFRKGHWLGRSETLKTVKIFTQKKNLAGQFVKVRITQAAPFALQGDIV